MKKFCLCVIELSIATLFLGVFSLSHSAVAGAAPTKKPATHKMDVWKSPADVKWGPVTPRLPAGAEMAVMSGDPSKSGSVSVRLKFPANYKIPPHFHPTDEHVTVISGSLMFGLGDNIDAKATQTVEAGGYFVAPKDMRHYVVTTTGAVVQVDLMGPFQITYENPADDPEKSKK